MSMECPYCGCELRLADDADVAARAPAMAQTTCASPRCARELWAELPSAEDVHDGAVRLLKAPPAAIAEGPPLGRRALSELVATVVIAIGATAFALVIGFGYVAWPDPGSVRTEAEVMGLTAIGAIVLAAGLLLDGALRRRRRDVTVSAEAPRVELVLHALPKGYRA